MRAGGLAGLVTRTELDTGAAPELGDHVAGSGLLGLESPAAGGPSAPDELGYELTVEDEGHDPRTVRLGESALSEGVRALVAWVDAHPGARRQVERPG